MKTMSELDDMIQKLCPDGVEFVKLGEVCDVLRGKRLTKKQLSETEKYPVFHGGIQPIGFYSKMNRSANTVMIINVGASAGTIGYSENEFWSSDGCYCLSHTESVLSRYIYFVLSKDQHYFQSKVRHGGIPTLDALVIRNYRIPLPPLEIQAEIVCILDKFTKLEAELEAELDCRKRQYEFYRDQLLSFDKLTPSDKYNVVWMKLSEVAFYAKTRISSKTLTPNSYVGVENLLKDKLGRMECTKTPTGMVIEYMPNDILIGNIRPYLRKIWKANCTGGTNGDVLCIRIKKETKDCISTDYLYHVLASELFFNYDIKCSKGAKMPRGDKELIMKYEVPIPPIEEQNRIVAILDRFDALTTSLQHGLPAEITARRQQYEYYRDKLLDFKRKNVQTESNKACF